MARTMNESSRMANAGVDTGPKMFGVWAGVIACPRARVQGQITCRICDEKPSLRKASGAGGRRRSSGAVEGAANAGVRRDWGLPGLAARPHRRVRVGLDLLHRFREH